VAECLLQKLTGQSSTYGWNVEAEGIRNRELSTARERDR
jgi:hypothetical protein